MFPGDGPGTRVRRRAAAAGALLMGAILLGSIPRPSAMEGAGPPIDVRLRIDPNVATREELMLLPRIGPVLADAIIDYRTHCGRVPAFRRAEDLDEVYRIGPRTVELLRPHLALGSKDSGEGARRRGPGGREGCSP